MSDEFYWIAVVMATVLSAARLTRLVVLDKFPPIVWIKNKYLDATDGSGYDLLVLCSYCFGFWMALLVGGWGWYAGVYEVSRNLSDAALGWWLVNALLALSYLTAMTVTFDKNVLLGDDD